MILLLCYDWAAVTTLASTQRRSHVRMEVSEKSSDVITQHYDTHRKICRVWFKLCLCVFTVLLEDLIAVRKIYQGAG